MKPEVEKKSWSALYNTLALVIFNTILIFILGNGAIGILLTMVEPTPTQDQRIIAHFGQGTLEKVYPGKTWPEIKTLLQETWSRTYLYEPFVQFREPPMEGQFVHVSQAGFRTHGPPIPWPPDRQKMNVFLFGGSTVFGYGVGDAETIAAHLEKRLAKTTQRPVHVYNFGQGFYYSSQELIQFQRLLVHGIQPDMAIFLDGLNDFFHDKDQPFFTERLRDAMSKTSPAQHLQAWAADWAVVRLANKVAKRLSPQTIPSPENNARTITSVI
ncbi:MAG TPA: SGNH/GDSL hydrolase family protein, partial [Magnetococcales bacterium]|nr:SGNH/GDSL hydrolase family protein [Magnetococcales bacterium]